MAQHLLANIPCQFINYLVCKEMKNIIFEPSTNSQTNCKKDLGVQREDRRINVQQKVNQLEASMMAFSEDFWWIFSPRQPWWHFWGLLMNFQSQASRHPWWHFLRTLMKFQLKVYTTHDGIFWRPLIDFQSKRNPWWYFLRTSDIIRLFEAIISSFSDNSSFLLKWKHY